MNKSLVVFRSDLVALTEGFVLAQGEGLVRHTAHYLGIRRVPGFTTPPERTFLVGEGGLRARAREVAFKVTGRLGSLSPAVLARAPVLVHAHFGTDGLRILPWARRHGLPLVVTFHGYDALTADRYARQSHYAHREYAKHKQQLARHGTKFIAVSKFLHGRLLQQGFPAERCVQHYIGIDVDKFTPDPGIAREPIVLFAGRLAPSKGCHFLIDAMREVQRELPDARLVIIGDGPDRAALEARARASLGRVELTGGLPPEEVRRWMRRASVLSVPSVTMHDGYAEAFGLVFAEAQAVGTPVVTFATGGIPEVVADGETGFLVQERDVIGLAGRLLTVLRDRACWQRLSEAGIARVRRQFDLRVQTRALEQIYDEVAAGGVARE